MNKNQTVTEQQIGKFWLRAVSGSDESCDDGISIFLEYEGNMIFCDNAGNNLHAAKEYIKANSKGKIKVVNGEFFSKATISK